MLPAAPGGCQLVAGLPVRGLARESTVETAQHQSRVTTEQLAIIAARGSSTSLPVSPAAVA